MPLLLDQSAYVHGPDYFHKRYYDVPASKQAVGSGLPGYHTGLGHFYLYRGEPVTHPSSAVPGCTRPLGRSSRGR